jgi:Putative beta-barrel porin 2
MAWSVSGQRKSTRRNMKNFFVSAGLVAIGVAGLQTAAADSATAPKYWNVSATLRGFYDDNYNIASSKQGSFGLELLPGFSFHMPLKQTDIGLRYTYGLYYYQDRDQLGVNPFDQTHQLDFWLDHAFSDRWKGNINDTFAVGQEPELLNPNPVMASAAPYRINGDNISNHGTIALSTQWTRQLSTVLSYGNNFYDYNNSGATEARFLSGGGATFAGLLDRIEQDVTLNLQWHLQLETMAFLGYTFSWVNYTAGEPIAAVPSLSSPSGLFLYHSGDRDMMSHTIFVGLEKQFTPNLNGSLSAGASYNDNYADPIFPTTSWTPYADASVSYTYHPGSYVQIGVNHSVSSTDQIAPDSNGRITQYQESSVVYLDVNHRFTPKLTGIAVARLQYSTFDGGFAGGSDETQYSIHLNLTYQINQFLSVDAGYNFDNLVTSLPGFQYTRNRVYLGLTANY